MAGLAQPLTIIAWIIVALLGVSFVGAIAGFVILRRAAKRSPVFDEFRRERPASRKGTRP